MTEEYQGSYARRKTAAGAHAESRGHAEPGGGNAGAEAGHQQVQVAG